MPATSFVIPLTSARRPSNSFLLLPHCYEDDTEQIPYRFIVIREEPHCRWHLPLWLLFFGVTVSILTLLFLLTGSMYPIHGWWTRYGSQSLGVFKDICRSGHPPSAINDTVSHFLAPISYVEPCRVFARSTRSGDFILPSTVMRRPSSSGPAFLVDNSLSLLVQVRIPDTSRDARCAITSGITPTRHLESAGKVARVQLWSLAGIMPDGLSMPGESHWLQREAHVSSFDVGPGQLPLQHSAEFACPSRSLQTFEVSCADEDEACSVEVWQGLFRVEVGS